MTRFDLIPRRTGDGRRIILSAAPVSRLERLRRLIARATGRRQTRPAV
jgi:hypothetical protein